jgi:signal peptidase I
VEQPSGSSEPVDRTSSTSSGPDAAPTSTRPSPVADDSFVAGRKGDPEREELKGTALSFLRELPVLIVLAFALAILLKTFVVQAFYIPSGSMEPTLKPGDRVLVSKLGGGPERGDIVVFEDPKPTTQPDRGLIGGLLHWLSEGLGVVRPADEDFIKRVIGLPGDTVELRNGQLFVDGKQIPEPYLKGPPDTRDFGPITVPDGDLFVLGDNRLNSNDSRFGLGYVPLDKVVGRAFVIIWPPTRMGWLH